MIATTAKHPTVNDLGTGFGHLIERQLETVFRKLFRGPNVITNRRFMQLILNEPHPLGNFAYVSDPASLSDTQAAIEPLLQLSLPTAIILSGPASAEVNAHITGLGYVLAEPMPAMGVDIDSLATVTLPSGYSFVETSSLADDAAWCEAFTEGYGVPHRLSTMFGPAAAHATGCAEQFRYFAIKRDGEIACTSMVYLEDGVAGIYGVSTRPAHRKKGLAAFATAEPLRKVRSEGYRTGLLQASLMGAPVYSKLGFKVHGMVPLYVKMPAGTTMPH